MSSFYCGIDLHTKTCQLAVIDGAGSLVAQTNLPTDLERIVAFLHPYGPDLPIAVESTINWYWLVDGLQQAGYAVHLAHTLGLYMISGAKVKTDRRDALKLAKYLRLGELPPAYIYPQEKRPLRDLLRRRNGLVQDRAGCYTSLRIQLLRYNQNRFSLTQLKQLQPEQIRALSLPAETQDFCVLLLERIALLSQHIEQLDHYLYTVTVEDPAFQCLLTLPGVGYTLALTLFYEVGDIHRFPSARHFASYARLAPSLAQSGQTLRRGRGSKQGNPHLKWAFTQAAHLATHYYPACKTFRDRHAQRRAGRASLLIANSILAHKLAIATYHLLTEEKPFEMNKLFA